MSESNDQQSEHGGGEHGALSSDGVVLIAEDDEINRVVASAILNRRGRRTAIARDGAEAVAMALSETFAAILMDCEMPELDGYEASRQIRAAESGERVPIIAMTAHEGAEGRERCLRAGMDDFLVKPLEPERLSEVVEAWIGRASIASAALEGLDSDELVDADTATQLREVLTAEMRTNLLVTFSASLPRCLSALEEARERGDSEELRRVVRLLKGSATTLGAARLRARCEAFERSADAGEIIGAERIEELRAVGKSSLAALRSSIS